MMKEGVKGLDTFKRLMCDTDSASYRIEMMHISGLSAIPREVRVLSSKWEG